MKNQIEIDCVGVTPMAQQAEYEDRFAEYEYEHDLNTPRATDRLLFRASVPVEKVL